MTVRSIIRLGIDIVSNDITTIDFATNYELLFRQANQYVEVEVNSTAPLKYISYEILGRGDILDAGSIYVQDKHTTSFR